MSSSSLHHQHLQRRVVRTLIALALIVLAIATPLVLSDGLRLDLAHTLGLAPGKGAEQLADGDDGAVLIVLPLGEYNGTGIERYAYEAAYIALPSDGGMELRDIETDTSVEVPLTWLEFIAADDTGEHLLLRGPAAGRSEQLSVLLTASDNTVETLPGDEATPDMPGDWETAIWSKVTGSCFRYSPSYRFVACFNRADAASYLAGDWQVDVQMVGDYHIAEPVYRGLGFLPIVGFAHDDTWLYLQNEEGIFRVRIPGSLLAQQSAATPPGDEHKP